jgi:hypothetical protein
MTLNIFSCPNCAVVLDGHSFHFPDQKLWFHENGAINENYAGQNYGVVSGKRKCPACKQDIYENEPDFVEHETPAQPETSRPEPPGYIEWIDEYLKADRWNYNADQLQHIYEGFRSGWYYAP